LSLVSVNQYSVKGGNVVINNQKIRYTPKSSFTGVDNFWYTFKDAQGRSNYGKATITVTAANSARPVANTDNYETTQGTAKTLNILANDTGSGLSIDNLYDYTAKGGTTSRSANNAVLYAPKAGFTGQDNFWYVIIDSQGRKNSAQVKINVTANQQDFFPVANPDNYTTARNTAKTLNILANDKSSSGIAIDTLYAWTSKGGRTSRSGNNVRYTPRNNFSGVDSFWYVMVDSEGRKNSAKVTITVSP